MLFRSITKRQRKAKLPDYHFQGRNDYSFLLLCVSPPGIYIVDCLAYPRGVASLRVRSHLESLMGTGAIKLNNRQYMLTLQKKLMSEYESNMNKQVSVRAPQSTCNQCQQYVVVPTTLYHQCQCHSRLPAIHISVTQGSQQLLSVSLRGASSCCQCQRSLRSTCHECRHYSWAPAKNVNSQR